jgi:hypothetical protein
MMAATTRSTIVQKPELLRLVQAIGGDLNTAIIYYEVFVRSGQDADLIDQVNRKLIHEGFNVISESLQLGVITTLCRIWDKTRGTASMSEVAKRLRKNPNLSVDAAACAQWLQDVESVEKSQQLDALRGYRNVGLAHRNNPNLPDPRSKGSTRRVLHGDERYVLDTTVSLVNRLDGLTGINTGSDFKQEQRDWQRRAANFWDVVKG